MLKRAAAVLGSVTAGVVLSTATLAGAASSTDVKIDIPVSGTPTGVWSGVSPTVHTSGFTTGSQVTLAVCKDKPTPGVPWSFGTDCSSNTSNTYTVPASGAIVFDNSASVGVFYGSNPDDPSNFACQAPGDPSPSGPNGTTGAVYAGGAADNHNGSVSSAGVITGTVCFVWATDSTASPSNQVFIPLNYVKSGGGGGTVPEAPMAILLPAAGVAAMAAGYFIVRNRRPAAA